MRNLIFTSVLLAAPQALADDPAAFTYSQFEASVPHFDLETCPKDVARQNAFCRMSFHNDTVNIFVFSESGDQPMIAFRTYEEDDFQIDLK